MISNSGTNAVEKNKDVVVTEQVEKKLYFQDSIAKFVLSNTPGSTGTVILDEHNSYFVSIKEEYVAATGEACREITLNNRRGVSRYSSVCEVNGVWKTINIP